VSAAPTHRQRARRALFGLAALTATCATPTPGVPRRPTPAGASPTASSNERAARQQALTAAGFELPARREPSAPRSSEPPALPAAFASPLELTLELTTTRKLRGRSVARREDVARGAHRVHVRVVEAGVEWLFIQNPLDARRVSARLVNHRRRTIIDYDESELRMNGIARGWSDVVGLGVDLSALQALELTGRTQRRFGFAFVEWRSAAGAPSREVWWSDEAAVPLHVAGIRAESVVEITSLRLGVERQRLIEPRERFAGYSVMDVADYREEHHDAVEVPARSPSVPTLDQRNIRPEAPAR
jgi:hypothetical protein